MLTKRGNIVTCKGQVLLASCPNFVIKNKDNNRKKEEKRKEKSDLLFSLFFCY